MTNDATATLRGESLEDQKCLLETELSSAYFIRSCYDEAREPDAWNFWDKEIDRLILQKDNLTTPAQAEADEADKDWHDQVTELRNGG